MAAAPVMPLVRSVQSQYSPANHPGHKAGSQEENTMSHLCISSLVVQTQPSLLADVRGRLNALSEAEVLGENDEGKLVVVLDTASNREAANLITDIQNQAGILSATLIYQYDDQFEPQVEDAA